MSSSSAPSAPPAQPPASSSSSSSSGPSDNTVFVGGLNPNIDRQSVEDLFKKAGNVKNVDLKKTYGFVHYENPDECDRAIKELNQQTLNGEKITVEIAKGKRTRPVRDRDFGYGRSAANRPQRTDYRVTVDNISSTTTWQDLKDFFKQCGSVVFADVFPDKHTGKAKYGIVEFKYYEDMKNAIKKFDNEKFLGKYIRVEEDNRRSYSRSRDSRYNPYPSERRHRRVRTRSRSRSYSPVSRSRSRSPSPAYRKKSRSYTPKDNKGSRSPSPKRSQSPRD